MKKVWNIVGRTIFWCAVVAFFIATALLRSRNESARRVERLEVVVKDASERGFITPETVVGLIDNEGINPVGQPLEDVDLAHINRVVEEYCFTERAITYVDYEGRLTVELTQREPIVRVCTSSGYDFYLTSDLYVLPFRSHATLNLPIVTGDVTFPFGTTFEGSLKEWLAGGEKNHRENYNFLSKLTNFVTFTERDPWLAGRVVQINLRSRPSSASKGAFQEPEVEIVPSNGDYLVQLGILEDVESKIARWRRFVEARVVELKGGVLDVRYDRQALWRKAQPKKRSKK